MNFYALLLLPAQPARRGRYPKSLGMNFYAFLLLLLLWASLPVSVCAAEFDLVIRHGRIVDGTGSPAYFADVGIREGRITAIGKFRSQAKEEIDGQGLIVAPGFIDVHTHSEEIVELPLAENFARLGVTSIVTGNCGGSALDIDAFFRRIEAAGVSINVAALIGHNTVRSHVMGGSFRRPPTEEELSRMKSLVEQAMKAGAVGLSTGLIYLPGTFSKTEEIIELAKVASAYDGIYASHIRDEGLQISSALAEVFRIAREAGIRAQISHLKLSGKSAWGRAGQVIAAIEKARAEGLDVTHDQYVYTASSTGISQLVPESAREGGKFRERLEDPAEKAKITKEMKERLQRRGFDDYAYAVIANYRKESLLNGLNIAEAARKSRGSDTLDDQIELILEIEKNGGASGVFHGMSEEDLQKFLVHPNTMFASDSGVRRFQEGVPHPRGYGNNARVLARYTRELKLLRLEEAIRRMTTLPAVTFRLRERGELREGNRADIVIFDPDKVQDTATYEDPHHYPAGIQHVLVNGVFVVKAGEHTGAKPGRPLRLLAQQ